MSNNIRRGPIPSDLGWLVDLLDKYGERLDALEAPDGTRRAGTVSHLAGLKTFGNSEALLNTGTVPNSGVIQWFFPAGLRLENISVPTGQLLVTASVGEASIVPGGSYVIAYIGFELYDANNALVPGIDFRSGQRYTNTREGLGISTYPQPLVIADMDANPGPYTVVGRVGMWVATLNTTACSTQFSDMSIVAQVIGEGRSL